MGSDELAIEVICTDLPGIHFIDPDDRSHRIKEPVYLGIQKGSEVIDAVPADTKQVVFKPVFRIAKQADGSPNFLGPFAQGRPEQRFFYLSWGIMHPDHRFEMFRRAKIHLNHLKWQHIKNAMSKNVPIKVVLRLTDDKGCPLCASVRDEKADWQV